MADESSAELLQRYRDDEPGAADQLFARYVERLAEVVRWHVAPALRRRLDPEDAVHSAYRSFFVRARDGQFTLAESGDLWRLLVTITLNKLRRQVARHRAARRDAGRDRSLSEAALGAIDLARGPTPLEALAAADELETFMGKLPAVERRVLELRLQGRTWSEIAAATGKAERTVRRALEEVRRRWADDPDARADISPARLPALAAPCPRRPAPAAEDRRAPLNYRDYLLLELVGTGGSGKVYRARHRPTGRTVAVKMLRKARWGSPKAVERFVAEAKVVSRLRHPGIVPVEGLGRLPGGGVFIVMEFVGGGTLEEAAGRRPPTPETAARWVAQAARAVDHAHHQGVVHLDLKPGNLLLDEAGRVRVTDFGLAASLHEPASLCRWAGTAGYMAPEQLDPVFGPIDRATDVFALGLVLHRLLTGRAVFQGRRVIEAIAAHAAGAHDWLGPNDMVAGGFGEVLKDCLALDPAARFSTAGALADRLDLLTEPPGG